MTAGQEWGIACTRCLCPFSAEWAAWHIMVWPREPGWGASPRPHLPSVVPASSPPLVQEHDPGAVAGRSWGHGWPKRGGLSGRWFPVASSLGLGLFMFLCRCFCFAAGRWDPEGFPRPQHPLRLRLQGPVGHARPHSGAGSRVSWTFKRLWL